MDIGERIKRARNARKWSQPRLAVAAGVGVNTVVQIEKGGDWKRSTVAKLTDALDLDLRITAVERKAA